MTAENDELLFSQLADGELPNDQANELLLRLLDAPAEREKLRDMLTLRRATAGWRARQPERPVMVVGASPHVATRRRSVWQLGRLAVAACVGGLLVMAGLRLMGPADSPSQRDGGRQVTTSSEPSAARVTPEKMQQVAKVFSLHESVAGPLAWYAADDQKIRLAAAKGPEASRRPIAVLLKLASDAPGSTERTLVIVCREDAAAALELPADRPDQTCLRLYLAPTAVSNQVHVRYAIAAGNDSHRPILANLTGQRPLSLAETSLGQLALGDRVVSVEAAAWPLRQETE